jgi:hypothetical protein
MLSDSLDWIKLVVDRAIQSLLLDRVVVDVIGEFCRRCKHLVDGEYADIETSSGFVS